MVFVLPGDDRCDLLRAQQHVLAAPRVVALDDALVGDLFAGALADALVADPVGGPCLELSEPDGLLLRHAEVSRRSTPRDPSANLCGALSP
jgi:hypothetical protein